MTEPRIAWEPENRTPLQEIEMRLSRMVKGKSGVSVLQNGTLLFVVETENNEESARKAIEEAKFLTDFEVVPLKEGGYFVVFHEAVAVFVGDEEYAARRSEIQSRVDELTLPSEKLLAVGSAADNHYLVGLYGRGKLYRDVFNFKFYKRVRG